MRKKRLAAGLYQRQLAERLGVDEMTVVNWEKNRLQPKVSHWPSILQFLGYDPAPAPQTFAERLLACRRRLGWSQLILAENLGVDEGSVRRWEQSKGDPSPSRSARLEAFLRRCLPD